VAFIELKLPVKPSGRDIQRSAVSVVARVGDELIVKADFRRWGDCAAVVCLKELFETGMWELPVADDNTQASVIEIGGVDAGNAVDAAGNLRSTFCARRGFDTRQPSPSRRATPTSRPPASCRSPRTHERPLLELDFSGVGEGAQTMRSM
jgi:hypothetical protein